MSCLVTHGAGSVLAVEENQGPQVQSQKLVCGKIFQSQIRYRKSANTSSVLPGIFSVCSACNYKPACIHINMWRGLCGVAFSRILVTVGHTPASELQTE